MKKAKILVAGSSVVDLIFKGKVFSDRTKKGRLSLAFGGKYVPEEFFQVYGGGGTNCAISLARQGFDTCLWSYVGPDSFGAEVIKNLKKEKVKTNLLRKKAVKTPLSSILLTPEGERTIINFRSNADMLEVDKKVLKEFKKRDWFVLFSLANLAKNYKLAFIKKAKQNNMKVFLSLHGTEYFKGLKYLKDYFSQTDILHLNAHELADIFGGDAPDFDFRKTNFAKKLNIPLLLTTYDIKGSFAYTKNKIYYQPIIKTSNVVDTTGAGDAWASGFLGEYLKTDSIKRAMLFAAKNSSSVIQKLGAHNGLLRKKA
jgi:ribokinase